MRKDDDDDVGSDLVVGVLGDPRPDIFALDSAAYLKSGSSSANFDLDSEGPDTVARLLLKTDEAMKPLCDAAGLQRRSERCEDVSAYVRDWLQEREARLTAGTLVS